MCATTPKCQIKDPVFWTRKELEDHCDEERHYVCFVCPIEQVRAYTSPLRLEGHLRERHFVCPTCEGPLDRSNTFATIEDLKCHCADRSHYSCWLCKEEDMSFKIVHYLRDHFHGGHDYSLRKDCEQMDFMPRNTTPSQKRIMRPSRSTSVSSTPGIVGSAPISGLLKVRSCRRAIFSSIKEGAATVNTWVR